MNILDDKLNILSNKIKRLQNIKHYISLLNRLSSRAQMNIDMLERMPTEDFAKLSSQIDNLDNISKLVDNLDNVVQQDEVAQSDCVIDVEPAKDSHDSTSIPVEIVVVPQEATVRQPPSYDIDTISEQLHDVKLDDCCDNMESTPLITSPSSSHILSQYSTTTLNKNDVKRVVHRGFDPILQPSEFKKIDYHHRLCGIRFIEQTCTCFFIMEHSSDCCIYKKDTVKSKKHKKLCKAFMWCDGFCNCGANRVNYINRYVCPKCFIDCDVNTSKCTKCTWCAKCNSFKCTHL